MALFSGIGTEANGWLVGMVKEGVLSLVKDPYPDVPNDYKIVVSMTFNGGVQQVTAIMQEDVTMDIESRWENFLQSVTNNELFEGLDMAMQAAGGSIQKAVFSRRIWKNSTPVRMTIPMYFIARTDPLTEVIQPIKLLQQYASPANGGALGTLIPPGSAPFQNVQLAGSKMPALNVSGKSTGMASLTIGTFLSFPRVIIQKVSAKFDTRVSAAPRTGKPLAVKAMVSFETYEIMVREDFEKAYSNVGQAQPGASAVAAAQRALTTSSVLGGK